MKQGEGIEESVIRIMSVILLGISNEAPSIRITSSNNRTPRSTAVDSGTLVGCPHFPHTNKLHTLVDELASRLESLNLSGDDQEVQHHPL